MDDPPPSPIGPQQAALIEGRVSIIVGTRDAGLRPHLMRALGCRLDDSRRRATVLLPRRASERVIEDVQANGRIAVVFSEPTTHRTLQLKGDDAQVVPCIATDAGLAEKHLREFIAEIRELRFAPEVALTIHDHDDGMIAVQFSVAEAFEQTPGPQAGTPLTNAERK
jgi:hypothetical protein